MLCEPFTGRLVVVLGQVTLKARSEEDEEKEEEEEGEEGGGWV